MATIHYVLTIEKNDDATPEFSVDPAGLFWRGIPVGAIISVRPAVRNPRIGECIPGSFELFGVIDKRNAEEG